MIPELSGDESVLRSTLNGRVDMSQRIETKSEGNDGGEVKFQKRKFSLASVLLPIFFLFLHQIVLNAMAFLRIYLYAKNTGLAGEELMRVFTRPDLFYQYLIASDAQNYASLLAMLILIPVYLLYLFWRRRKDSDIVRLQRQGIVSCFESVVLIIGTLGLTQLWMAFLLLFEEADNFIGKALRDYLIQAEMLTSEEGSLWLQVISLVVLVPIAEELLFRGILQGELSLRFSRTTRVLVCSVVFAVFHFDLIQGSYVFLAGIVLSLAYELTNNLFVPVFMHMVFNFVGGGILQRIFNLDEQGAGILLILLFVFIPLALAVLAIWFRRDKEKREKENYGLNNDLSGKI